MFCSSSARAHTRTHARTHARLPLQCGILNHLGTPLIVLPPLFTHTPSPAPCPRPLPLSPPLTPVPGDVALASSNPPLNAGPPCRNQAKVAKHSGSGARESVGEHTPPTNICSTPTLPRVRARWRAASVTLAQQLRVAARWVPRRNGGWFEPHAMTRCCMLTSLQY